MGSSAPAPNISPLTTSLELMTLLVVSFAEIMRVSASSSLRSGGASVLQERVHGISLKTAPIRLATSKRLLTHLSSVSEWGGGSLLSLPFLKTEMKKKEERERSNFSAGQTLTDCTGAEFAGPAFVQLIKP